MVSVEITEKSCFHSLPAPLHRTLRIEEVFGRCGYSATYRGAVLDPPGEEVGRWNDVIGKEENVCLSVCLSAVQPDADPAAAQQQQGCCSVE